MRYPKRSQCAPNTPWWTVRWTQPGDQIAPTPVLSDDPATQTLTTEMVGYGSGGLTCDLARAHRVSVPSL